MSEHRFYKSHLKSGTKLLRPMGFEFTFEKKGRPFNHTHNKIEKSLSNKKYRIHHCDGGIEINSPVFQYMEDVLKYWNKLNDICKKNNYIPKNKNSTGGGTHIHIGFSNKLNGFDDEFVRKLGIICYNRPWLTWAFQDPSDNDSSEPICLFPVYYKNIIKKFSHIGITTESTWGPQTDYPYRNFGDKQCTGTSIRTCEDNNTIEMRFFDTVCNESELKAHILATNYLIKLALRKRKEKMKSFSKKQVYNMLIKGKALKEFNKFKIKAEIEYSNNNIIERAYWEKIDYENDELHYIEKSC